MSVFSIPSLTELQIARRFDAEHFRPEYIENQRVLSSIPTVRLRSVARVRGGYAWRSEFFMEEGGEPVVRIRDIRPGVIDPEALSGLDPSYVAREKKGVYALQGELVVGMDGLDHFSCGYIPTRIWVNQRVAIITSINSDYPAEYLLAVINSSVGQRQLLQKMTIATTVGHITNEDIRNLKIPVLNASGRKRIAESIKDVVEARLLARQRLTDALSPLNTVFLKDAS